jgi:hypothetical protein
MAKFAAKSILQICRNISFAHICKYHFMQIYQRGICIQRSKRESYKFVANTIL